MLRGEASVLDMVLHPFIRNAAMRGAPTRSPTEESVLVMEQR